MENCFFVRKKYVSYIFCIDVHYLLNDNTGCNVTISKIFCQKVIITLALRGRYFFSLSDTLYVPIYRRFFTSNFLAPLLVLRSNVELQIVECPNDEKILNICRIYLTLSCQPLFTEEVR
jgi:hypothetical protein